MLKTYLIQLAMIASVISLMGVLPALSDMLSAASVGDNYAQISRPHMFVETYTMASREN